MDIVKKLTTQRSDIPRGVKVLAFMDIMRKKAILLEALSMKL